MNVSEKKIATVVSLFPCLTETLHAWKKDGAGFEVVGRTSYCRAEHAEGAEVIGPVRGFDVGKLSSLEPDLVLISEEENDINDYEKIRDIGLKVEVIPAARLSAVPSQLGRLRSLLGVNGISSWEERLRDAVGRASRLSGRRVLVPVWMDPFVVCGEGTYLDDLLRWAGMENVVKGEGYVRPTREELERMAPDMVLLPDAPYDWGERGRDFWEGMYAWARVVAVREDELFWWGRGSLRGLGKVAALGGVSDGLAERLS